MTIPAPHEFWTLNNTLVGINGDTLVSNDGLAYFVDGKIGQAWDMAYDGFRRLSTSTIPPINGSWAMSCWAKRDNTLNRVVELVSWGNAELGRIISVEDFWNFAGRSLRVYVDDVQRASLATTKGTNWNHFAVSYDASEKTLTLWMDGVGVVTSSVEPPTATPTLFGCGIARFINGQIDAVGVWSQPLTQAAVDALYNSGNGWEPTTIPDPDPPGETLVLRWKASGEITILRNRE